MVEKGTISSLKGSKADIKSDSGIMYRAASIPKIFQFEKCCDCEYSTTCYICDKLKIGDTVVFSTFEDGISVILQKV